MEVKREYSFDVLRVFAMVMVIMVHVSNVYSRYFGYIGNDSYGAAMIFNTISRISVPIFFMISGALLVDRAFNKTKYFKRLLKFFIIIVVWDIIYLIWEYLYLGLTYDNLFMLFIEPYRAHLWFLYTIIILYFLQPMLKIILNKSNIFVKVMLFIIWFIFNSMCMFYNVPLQIIAYIGFFVIGKYLYDFVKKYDLRKYNFLLFIIMLSCFSCSVYLNYKASIKFDMFYNMFFAYRTPFTMIASFAFFTLIYNLFTNREPNKIVMVLSDLSLGVYLIHGIFLDITCQMFDYSAYNALYGIPIFTFVILIISCVAVYLLRKFKIFRYVL